MLVVDIEGLRQSFLNIFDDPTVCIREIIQNAWEAILVRRQVEPEHAGRIRVDVDGQCLRLHDDGCGIRAADLEDRLSRVFRSSWAADGSSAGIGQFGMGLKTCLILGDRLRVVSRSIDESETWAWTLSASGDGTVEIERCEDRGEPGTTISIDLGTVRCGDQVVSGKELLGDRESVVERVRYFADFLPCPIEMDEMQINLGGLCGFDAMDYEPEEWLFDRSPDIQPLARFVLSDSETSSRGMLFAMPAQCKETPQLTLYRRGIRVGGIDSDDVFAPHGHRMAGFIDCPALELYVDRHRVKPGDKFDELKSALNDELDKVFCDYAAEKPQSFNEIVRSSEVRMKHALYVRDDWRREVCKTLRMLKTDGRWISIADFVDSSPVLDGRRVLFFADDSPAQRSLLPIYNGLGVPVLKATLMHQDNAIDALLIKEIGSDVEADVRRVDQGLELVLSYSETADDRELAARFSNATDTSERVLVFHSEHIHVPILYRVSDQAVGQETASPGERLLSGMFNDILERMGDDAPPGGLREFLERKEGDKRGIVFLNAGNRTVGLLRSIPDEGLFNSLSALLLLNAQARSGQQLTESQVRSQHDSIAKLIDLAVQPN